LLLLILIRGSGRAANQNKQRATSNAAYAETIAANGTDQADGYHGEMPDLGDVADERTSPSKPRRV
jgi:hypothetical protein